MEGGKRDKKSCLWYNKGHGPMHRTQSVRKNKSDADGIINVKKKQA